MFVLYDLTMKQITLFDDVLSVYSDSSQTIDNKSLYQKLVEKNSISEKQLHAKNGDVNVIKRKIRWIQQTLKQLGLISKSEKRGEWSFSNHKKLEISPPNRTLIAFSTYLGIALWSECHSVFSQIDEPIHLCLTSPPYPLKNPRAYGNASEMEYVDWLIRQIEPIVKHLVPGGSIVLNVGNDIFLNKSCARSLYRERLVIALSEKLGLYKMDELVWHNPCRPPGPLLYASIDRTQLNATWDPIYWFTNDPSKVRSNNNRVLQPHSSQHTKLIQNGGTNTSSNYGDGAYKRKKGSFGQVTEGKIPRNLMTVPHNCPEQSELKKYCNQKHIISHGAAMPASIAQHLISFLTTDDEMVVDPFGGSMTTAAQAEKLNRRWITTEKVGQYCKGGESRFFDAPGFQSFI